MAKLCNRFFLNHCLQLFLVIPESLPSLISLTEYGELVLRHADRLQEQLKPAFEFWCETELFYGYVWW